MSTVMHTALQTPETFPEYLEWSFPPFAKSLGHLSNTSRAAKFFASSEHAIVHGISRRRFVVDSVVSAGVIIIVIQSLSSWRQTTSRLSFGKTKKHASSDKTATKIAKTT